MNKTAKTEKLGLKELIAMGVGGMVGGGIFSVLGLSVALAGHAAPIAFIIGGIIASLTGFSYTKLGLTFRSDGGSFTYLERAFSHRNVAGIGGWMLVAGYIGTMALYAFTFGVYGAAMLGAKAHLQAMHHLLQSLILLLFMGINLYGIKAAGESEDLIVMVKVLILSLFAFAGLFYIRVDHLVPVFNMGGRGVLMGAALVFVAYEGFELIPNAVNEMKDPGRDLGRGILISIGVTIAIYILVSLVAVGNLLPAEISKYKEYALAVAAKPFLGKAGFMLIGLGALLSTASAINATMFGTARLAMVMAQDSDLPKVFSHRERRNNIPYVSLIFITVLTLLFVNTTDLTIISSFASSTFLLLFAAINLSAVRLRKRIGINMVTPLSGLILSLLSWLVLCVYLYRSYSRGLVWIGAIYLCVVVAELFFSERRLFFKQKLEGGKDGKDRGLRKVISR
ncbi:MAG: amino acid permease [Nitrospirae bacterium]|nr:amino acid permease [Nitrospirota bacterium]